MANWGTSVPDRGSADIKALRQECTCQVPGTEMKVLVVVWVDWVSGRIIGNEVKKVAGSQSM